MVRVLVAKKTVNVSDLKKMRHGTSSRRQRSRNTSGRRNNQQRTQVFDSNGPDVRIRGTAHQVAEKYLTLAKDANSAGDIIVAENYYQHAEHYIRIINENNGKFDASRSSDKASARDDAGNRSNRDGAINRNKRAQKPKNVVKDSVDDLALPSSIVGKPVTKAVEKSKECEAVS